MAPQHAAAGSPGRRRVLALMRYRSLYLAWTALVLVVAATSVALRGFHMGIDFTGGTLLDRTFTRPVTAQAVRQALSSPELADLGLGGAVVQPSPDGREVLIRTRPLDAEAIRRVDDQLERALGGLERARSRTEVVGPVIGQELVRQALWAIGATVAGILLYVSLRFEYRFGVSAIVALIHDVLVVLALFSLARLEVNVSSVAAVLTVLGYSVNDTIVVFDRIREKLQRVGRGVDFGTLADEAITETLPRTINTASTTLVVVAALLLLGGSTLRDFMLALLVGILAGTYSSIFVASALWVTWRNRDGRRAAASARG